MSLHVVFSPNPIQPRDARLAQQFEQVVAETLRGYDGLAGGGPVSVRFHAWDGDNVPRYVCKIECSGAPIQCLQEPPWRWWSALVETPQELAQELREALRALSQRRRSAAEERRAPVPVERWGWAGEMQLR